MLSALLFSSLLGASPDLGTLREVRSTFIEDGVDRVTVTRTHRVVSRPDGSLELQGAQPLRLSLDSVRRERGVPCLTPALAREVDVSPHTVRTTRACGLEETWTNGADGLAHAFTVQRPPDGRGGLTLRVSVEGPWHHQDDAGHVFKGPGAAALIRYGNAFVVRDGRRFPIPVVRVDGALELRVPRRLVEAPGAFPMHIDPVLSSEVPLDPDLGGAPPPSNESAPAVAVNAAGVALVVWVDERRQLGMDLFGARFDPNSGLVDRFGIPIVEGRGDQRRPTVCGQGDSFLIAWDTFSLGPDAGLEVHARELTANGTLTPEVTVVSGSQASLAAAGDGGASVLAWVDTTSTVRVAPMSGTVKGPTFNTPTLGVAETASRPFIAASDRSWFVVWETQVAGNATSAIRGLASAGTTHLLTALTAPVPASRPTVALSAEGAADLAHVYWQSGPGTIGGGTITGTAVALGSPFAGTSPFVVRTSTADGVLPTLGSFSVMTLNLRDLNGGVTSLSVGARPGDLVLGAGASGRFAAWTEGPVGAGDVVGAAITSSGAGQRQAVSFAATTQRLPHVALWDDGKEGLAVWVEGVSRIMAAKVKIDVDGLTFGNSPFEIANPNESIEQLDVAATASGPLYLVVWRQPGAVTGQLTNGGSPDGPPIALSTLSARFGPAVAWDEGGGAFRVAWSEGLDADLVSREVPLMGTLGVLQTWATGVSDVDLTCLRSQCLLAWQVHTPRAVHAQLLGRGATPFVQQMASQPSVAHDGTDFFIGWRADNGLSFVKMDFGTGSVQPLGVGVRPPIGSVITHHTLAPASPPVVVWSEETFAEQRAVVLQRLDFLDTSLRFDGLTPHVATMGITPQGLLVYERYVADAGINAMRAFGTAFAWPFDAGTPDGGLTPADGGTRDGGSDAGVVPSDGGVDVDAGSPPVPDAGMAQFGTSGCGGCNATFLSPLWWLVLLAFARRKTVSLSLRSGERVGVRGRSP